MIFDLGCVFVVSLLGFIVLSGPPCGLAVLVLSREATVGPGTGPFVIENRGKIDYEGADSRPYRPAA